MTDLTFEEQDLVIDKLIEKYLGGHRGCGNNLEINHPVFCMVTFIHPIIDYDIFSPNMFEEEASVDFVDCEAEVFSFTIQELQQKYFQDILLLFEDLESSSLFLQKTIACIHGLGALLLPGFSETSFLPICQQIFSRQMYTCWHMLPISYHQ